MTFRIRAKLLTGLGIPVLLMAIVGLAGWWQSKTILSEVHSLYAHNTQAAVQLGQAQDQLWELRYGLAQFMAANAEQKAQILADEPKLYKHIDANIKAYTAGARTPEETQALKEWDEAYSKYAQARPRWFELYSAGKIQEAAAWRAQTIVPSGAGSVQALTRLIELQRQVGVEKYQSALASAATSSKVLIGLTLVALIIGAGVALFLSRRIADPIITIADSAAKISFGDIDQKIAYQSTDEIGALADAFRDLIGYMKGLAETADALGRGDLSVQIIAKSEQDVLSRNLIQATEALRTLVEETNGLIQHAQNGELHYRGNGAKFQGGYADLVEGMNRMLNAVVEPIHEAAEVLEKVAARDLTVRMVGHYKGEYAAIKTALNTAVTNLDDALAQVAVSSEQVSAAAGEIIAGSQSLAQGASEQASSLEEVSSSLQEMSSMTKQNAGNAQEAKGLSDGARSSAARGMESMRQLSDAIHKIKVSADATAKIVKTIDEIAFQTNLLALNAAVEAARAGDAGKGFAVVAEEVRNLAMRSAEAAKNTAHLIEESVKNAEGGVTVNQEVLKSLEEINDQVNKVSEVMAEIATASDQQSQGVDQINVSIEQMNQVTQQTAANAEESASASGELSGQAEDMRSLVGTFHFTHRGALSEHPATSAHIKDRAPQRATLPPKRPAQAPVPAGSPRVPVSPAVITLPEKIIPLHDSEDDLILHKF